MIPNSKLEYLTPTKDLRRLSILHAIYKDPEGSQHTIGENTRLSGSMVNNYIKELTKDGDITIAGDTNRTRSYHLTPAGKFKLSSSLFSYSAEIVQLYGTIKRKIMNILKELYKNGIRTVVLFGAAETAEIVFAAINMTQIVVIGVVDNDPSKQGNLFNGLLVQPPEKLDHIRPDSVLITSFAQQEEICKSVENYVGKNVKITKLSVLEG